VDVAWQAKGPNCWVQPEILSDLPRVQAPGFAVGGMERVDAGLAGVSGSRFGAKWGDGCSTGDTRRVRTGRAQEVEVIVSAFA
jgi:hypothetical protein